MTTLSNEIKVSVVDFIKDIGEFFAAIAVLFVLPWLDRSPIKSIRYRGMGYKVALGVFVISFIVLGWLGTQPPTPTLTLMAQIFSALYFGYFVFLYVYTKHEKGKPVPDRVTQK